MHQSFRCPNCDALLIEGIKSCPECGTYIFPSLPDESHEYPPDFIAKPRSSRPFTIVIAIILIAIILVAVFAITFIEFMANQNKEEEDITPPTVVNTDPADGATDVEPFFSLKIFFSEPVTNCTTLHYNLYPITTNDSKTIWIDDKTVEITDLMFQTFGPVIVDFYVDTNLRDMAGNMMATDYQWTFTTRPPKVNILSTTTFYSEIDRMVYIYGEVRNREDFDLMAIEFNITGYNANQELVETSYFDSYTSPLIIEPDETVVYMGHYVDTKGVVEKVEFEVFNKGSIVMVDRYEGLEIIEDEGYFEFDEDYECYIINGTIKNNGDRLAEDIIVTATYYDSSGHIVAANYFSTDPSELDVSNTLDFEIWMYDIECELSSIDSYSLIAHEFW